MIARSSDLTRQFLRDKLDHRARVPCSFPIIGTKLMQDNISIERLFLEFLIEVCCSELVYTVVNELLAILYYSIGLKSYLLVTQFSQI